MEEYINEFKRLEKLCNEIYGQQHGVTQYITDMEQTPNYLAKTVPEWDDDLKCIKRLRHIRNALVHDTSEEIIEYTREDIEDIRIFYDRIMRQRDPLSLLNKAKRRAEEIKTNPTKTEVSFSTITKEEPQSEKKILRVLLLLLLILAGAIWLGIIVLKYTQIFM